MKADAVQTITRTMDATRLNAVANHPDVRVWLGGEGVLDLTATIRDASNLAFVSAHGGFVCLGHGQGRYEVHSLFTPDRTRGETIHAAQAVRDYLFSETDATELVTKVPQMNRAALGLAQLTGFQRVFTGEVQWSAAQRWKTDFMRLSIERWAATSYEALRRGKEAHEIMEAMTVGSSLPPHSPEDDSHLHMTGACWWMLRSGQVQKGVQFYQRYAQWSGYPTIRLLREHPTVIEMDGLVVEMHGERYEVLACPSV